MRAARVDANQAEITEALRGVGATVTPTHTVGKGFVDLVVGFRGENYLLELKTPHGGLSPWEQIWHDSWRGRAHIVRSVEDALTAIGAVEYR